MALVYKSIQLKSCYQNLLSAMNHAQVVQAYLDKKLGEQVIKANHHWWNQQSCAAYHMLLGDIIACITAAGRGSVLAKMDIK